MADEIVIRTVDLSKQFSIRKDKSLKERVLKRGRGRAHAEQFWALREVNLEIASGHTIGLIGPNGSGKSTLLQMITGIITPTAGYVERTGRVAALLNLGAGFHPDLTGRENVYLNASILGLSRKEIDRHFDAIVEFSEIQKFIDTPVKFYSSGMYVRLAFAVAVHVDPDILIIDEVLSVGDEAFQRKCRERIEQFQQQGKTIVLVTHSLEQVQKWCDRAILLVKGDVVAQGDPKDVVARFREMQGPPTDSAPARQRTDVSIAAARALDPDGVAASTFASGSPVSLDLGIASDDALTGWAMRIELRKADGTLAHSMTTSQRGIELPALVGRATVRIDFPALPLAAGNYHADIAVLASTGHVLHDRKQAVRFAIARDCGDGGVVALDPTVRMAEDLAPARTGE
ncbi:ABC transporter ATP-binding protein [Hoyosella sp. G463]|uniref:ABC transporter ATP-binding protein n=1 Tax=Lolliginicoccus lacisalsi TaxID=2742202 RepID=A0A927JF32_9ACTN|nr:ABC transporter ATP-binding protein [Lolliginicoccus lacisalsi]MBD8507587.1 ABC transporter ATP-binding protein [Lolliginicoccus lacisalsi]